jgi:hypothetical protein
MRAIDILHGLADLLAGIEGSRQAQQLQTQSQPAVTMVQVSADKIDHSDSGTFVPPLQAKIELLKKSVGVDNVYDQDGPDEQLTGQGADNEDELSRMRKMAGINPTVADEAASDEPLDA